MAQSHYRNLTFARHSVWPTPELAQLLTRPPLTRTSNLPHLKVSDDIQSLSRIVHILAATLLEMSVSWSSRLESSGDIAAESAI